MRRAFVVTKEFHNDLTIIILTQNLKYQYGQETATPEATSRSFISGIRSLHLLVYAGDFRIKDKAELARINFQVHN